MKFISHDFLVCVFIITLLCLLSCDKGSVERPNIQWTRTYGGEQVDIRFCVEQTSDIGYIVVGRTESFGAGHSDVWLLKINESGDTLWTHIIGGPEQEWSYCVQQTDNDGYIMVGYTDSYGFGISDLYLMKIEPDLH